MTVTFKRTETMPPGSGSEDWEAYFRGRRKEREEADTAAQEVDDEEKFVVTIPGHEVGASELPTAAKKLMLWLEQNPHWRIFAQHSQTHHQPVLMKEDGKEARKGDIRTPEQDIDHWSIRAILTDGKRVAARLSASWDKPESGKSVKFDGAVIWDAITKQQVVETQVGPFHDWLRTFAPDGAPKVAKPKQSEVSLLEIDEWRG